MLKLYREFRDGVRYWEAWEDEEEEKVVVHWGRVGERGESKDIPLHDDDDAETVIEREAKSARKDKYIEVQPRATLVITYQCADWGGPEDLDRRHRIEVLMDECLSWTGNGHVDSGDIGSGTINVLCFVINTAIGAATAIEALRSEGLLDGATIITLEDVEDEFEEHRIWWPSISAKKPARKAKALRLKDIAIPSLNGQRIQCINCREPKMVLGGWHENQLQCRNCGHSSFIEKGRGICEKLLFAFGFEQACTMHKKCPSAPASAIARRLIVGDGCARLRNTELTELALELHKMFAADTRPSAQFYKELSHELKTQLSKVSDSSGLVLTNSSPNFLPRYRAGECEDVWREIAALGPKHLQYDVSEVILAALGRIYENIQHAFALLSCDGFQFDEPMPIEALSNKMIAQLEELEDIVCPLPLAVSAFASSFGNVRFHGHFPDNPARQIESIHVDFTTALQQYKTWLDEWTEESPKFSIALSFGPRNAVHQHQREPYRIRLPNDKIDPVLLGEPEQITFLDYLRRCFEDLAIVLKTKPFREF